MGLEGTHMNVRTCLIMRFGQQERIVCTFREAYRGLGFRAYETSGNMIEVTAWSKPNEYEVV